MQWVGSALTGEGSLSHTWWSTDFGDDSTRMVSRLRMKIVFVDQLWCFSLIGNNHNRGTD